MLAQKTAIVTGGAQGIGKAIVKEFIKNHCNVYVIDMKIPEQGAYLADVNGTEENCHLLCADITNFDEIITICDIIAEKGPVDILINNAGITKDSSFRKMTEDVWQKVIDVNLNGTFHMCKAVVPYMIQNGAGKIVNMASASAHGQFGQANYAASKAGIIGLTKTLALELAKYKINVNAISPGFTLTEMTAVIPDDIKAKYYKEIPMGRGAAPEEIAYLVRFLASRESDFITGQEIMINGGYIM